MSLHCVNFRSTRGAAGMLFESLKKDDATPAPMS